MVAVETSAPSEPSLEAPSALAASREPPLISRGGQGFLPACGRPHPHRSPRSSSKPGRRRRSQEFAKRGQGSEAPEAERGVRNERSQSPGEKRLKGEPLGGTADKVPPVAEVEPVFPVMPAITARKSSCEDHPPPGIGGRSASKRIETRASSTMSSTFRKGARCSLTPVVEREPEPSEARAASRGRARHRQSSAACILSRPAKGGESSIGGGIVLAGGAGSRRSAARDSRRAHRQSASGEARARKKRSARSGLQRYAEGQRGRHARHRGRGRPGGRRRAGVHRGEPAGRRRDAVVAQATAPKSRSGRGKISKGPRRLAPGWPTSSARWRIVSRRLLGPPWARSEISSTT